MSDEEFIDQSADGDTTAEYGMGISIMGSEGVSNDDLIPLYEGVVEACEYIYDDADIPYYHVRAYNTELEWPSNPDNDDLVDAGVDWLNDHQRLVEEDYQYLWVHDLGNSYLFNRGLSWRTLSHAFTAKDVPRYDEVGVAIHEALHGYINTGDCNDADDRAGNTGTDHSLGHEREHPVNEITPMIISYTDDYPETGDCDETGNDDLLEYSERPSSCTIKAIEDSYEHAKDPYHCQEDGSACFITTATANEQATLDSLRRFRDESMRATPLGRGMVGLYYRISPPIARTLARHPESIEAATTRRIIQQCARLSDAQAETSSRTQRGLIACLLTVLYIVGITVGTLGHATLRTRETIGQLRS